MDTDSAMTTALAGPGDGSTSLLQALIGLQRSLGWLPRHVLAPLAAQWGLTLAQVEAVAGFYRFLHREPVGRCRVLFADNVIERHQGSCELMAQLCRRLGVQPGQVRSDGAVSVDTTSCIGLPDQGPAVLVNHEQVVTRLDARRIDDMAALIDAGVPPHHWPADWQQVHDEIRVAGPLLAPPPPAGEALRAARARGVDGFLAELQTSRLRGRGGAGYPTAAKWAACLATPAAERVVVCNADEGEPGTFKDRALLRHHAHTLLDGMAIAAWALGARRGFIYLRGEYRWLAEGLQAAIAARRGNWGFDFDIALHLGAGAYVCGEESALIESLEGRRGVPRIRPPFPAQRGWRGLPTVVNNVETFCAVAHVALQGAAAWTALGTPQSSGSKIHSVSGDCDRPGLYELPWGTPVAGLLLACGARDAQAVQVGGPSGQCLAPAEFARTLAFEDVPSAGAFMVFDARRDLFEVARGFAQFFAHESCGFCTPCRVGTALLARRMDKLAAGAGSHHDLDVLLELDALLHQATHCGLGATACNPLRDTLARFRPAYERRLGKADFEPGFDLDAELAPARALTGRDDAGAHILHPAAR